MYAEEPLVSIITLNYNQTGVTCKFLESARQLLYTNYEILVCDMASDCNPTDAICAGNYQNTKVLRCKDNLGFAGGNNWGIHQAKGEFIFIVNNDTVLTPSLVGQLVQPFYNDPTVGACSPKIKFFDQTDLIQYAGFRAMNMFTGRTGTIGENEKDTGQYNTPGYTHAAHGCAMMVRRKVLKETGLFPECFFLYYEEWDLSARIAKLGYSIWYAADAVIYHKESVTVGKSNPMKTYYLTRNRILFMRRNAGFFQFVFFCLFFALFTMPKAVVIYCRKKQIEHIKFFFKGVGWNILHSSHSSI